MKSTNSLRTSFYTTVGALLLTLSSFAQAPEKMSYQAVIRDASNALVTNQQVGMQISILQGSTAVYEETQTPTSNTNGLVSLEIGTGTVISGFFPAIDWSAGTYFIKTETDPTGATNYTITGTSQLLSVPYALYANTSSDTEAVAVNTAKVGYTEAAVSVNTDVAANTAKVGYTEAAVSVNTDVAANTAKTGITSAQANEIVANTTKVGITAVQASAITDNTAKTGIITDQSDAIVLNTAKVGITSAQASAITDNTAKVGYTEAAVSVNTDVAANTAKTGITSAQANEIVANTTKVGITAVQASAITDNTAKYSKNEVDALIANLERVLTDPIVGDIRAGGVVFWVDPFDNRHGLVCAFSDYSTTVQWGCDGTDLQGVPNAPYNPDALAGSGAEIGDGVSNTNNILIDCSDAPAALAARSLGAQWFLPSAKELNEMYNNRTILEAVSVFTEFSPVYWSSTEFTAGLAWGQNFFSGGGSHNAYNKSGTINVRAVRAF